VRIPYIAIFILILAVPAHAFRCGSELVNEGDSKAQVIVRCGEPEYKEVIGYIDQLKSGDRIRVMKIESWIYYIKEYQTEYVYTLEFEGNILKKITHEGKKL